MNLISEFIETSDRIYVQSLGRRVVRKAPNRHMVTEVVGVTTGAAPASGAVT